MPSSFESKYPAITRWAKEFGRIEIGYDSSVHSFVKAIDEGGTPWGGKSEHETIDEALDDLERGIITFLKEQDLDKEPLPGQRPSRRVAKPARRTTGRSGRKKQRPPARSEEKRHPPEDPPFVKKVRKLGEIAEALRRGENFSITRLTILKSLCQDPKAAGAFALFLIREVQKQMRGKKSEQRYQRLVNRAVKELGPYLGAPSMERRERLRSLFHEMQAEQNEYKPMRWGVVRIVKSMNLLVAEKALRAILRPDEASHWLYHTARDYAERYDPRYGTGLIPESAPMVEDIAKFWRKFFGIRR
jgi:hypothetical protein